MPTHPSRPPRDHLPPTSCWIATIIEPVPATKEIAQMTLKTHSGSCHFGAVRFEADVDIAEGTIKCNCSSCTKARSWLIVAPAGRYRVVSGAESQAGYQWTPQGRSGPTIQFLFCKVCGIRTAGTTGSTGAPTTSAFFERRRGARLRHAWRIADQDHCRTGGRQLPSRRDRRVLGHHGLHGIADR